MNVVLALASWLCFLAGAALAVIGAAGLLKFPDFFTRIHAASVTDTMAAGLIVLGLMLQAGLTLVTVKLALVFLFLTVTGPTATHALAKAALHGSVRPVLDEEAQSSSN